MKPMLVDHDRFLPIANIGRIMKESLDPVGKSTKVPHGRKKEKRQRQTMYEQYEESGSDEDNSDLQSDESSNVLSRDFGNYGKNMFLPNMPDMRGNAATKISREARETMQECVTEFLLFVTSEA
jgi:histone H3/H4